MDKAHLEPRIGKALTSENIEDHLIEIQDAHGEYLRQTPEVVQYISEIIRDYAPAHPASNLGVDLFNTIK